MGMVLYKLCAQRARSAQYAPPPHALNSLRQKMLRLHSKGTRKHTMCHLPGENLTLVAQHNYGWMVPMAARAVCAMCLLAIWLFNTAPWA